MSVKILVLFAVFVAALASPQIQPRQIQPRQSTCAAMPYFLTANRIVNGQDAPSMIPWQVWVIVPPYTCGGTILDSKTILSAAHCTTHLTSLNGVYIRAGTTDKTQQGQTIQVSMITYNQDQPYDSRTSNNDVVILKLATALQFNNDVTPACLPDDSWNPSVGTNCFVSGWGALYSDGPTPDTLKWVSVPIVGTSTCANNYANVQDAEITGDSMICAGYTQGGKDSCQGDSGGPFVCPSNGQAILTGVVSFGQGCAAPGYPGVYARVTNFLPWIKSKMEPGEIPSPSPAPSPPSSTCPHPSWIKDKYCDDANNVEACQFDGGDCCGDNVKTNYCTDCKCLQKPDPITCAKKNFYKDGWCDDENNVWACDYDGGDCCGGKTGFCNECKCKQP